VDELHLDHEITHFAIYPSIGVARIGNSPEGYFFGPEQPGAPRSGPYRDAGGVRRARAALAGRGLLAEAACAGVTPWESGPGRCTTSA
jgi:hypothetical protein